MARHIPALAWIVLSGALLGLASPPSPLPALAWLCVPAWLAGLEARDAQRPAYGPLQRAKPSGALLGWLLGFVVNTVALSWTVGLLRDFAHFPVAVAVLVSSLLWAAQAMPFAIAGFLVDALPRDLVPRWLALPLALTLCLASAPAIFPWHLADTQIDWTSFVQLADIGGEPMLDLAIALGGAGLLTAVLPRTRDLERLAALSLGLLAFLVPLTYGGARLDAIREARSHARELRVGVVQPNVGIREKHDGTLAMQHAHQLRRMTRELEARGAELVVWPETAFPFAVMRTARADDPSSVFSLRGPDVHGPLLAGTITLGSVEQRYNSAVGVDAEGHLVGRYDKMELLVFGEYVPLWQLLTPIHRWVPRPGLTPGNDPRPISLANARLGVLVCYEDILPDVARRVAWEAPNLLVNVTNDAWFGDTLEPHQHHALARFRAIETRRDLVRAVNTGVSAHILATGEDTQRTRTFVERSFVAKTKLLSGMTTYVALGPWVPGACAGALLGAALAVLVTRRRARQAWRNPSTSSGSSDTQNSSSPPT